MLYLKEGYRFSYMRLILHVANYTTWGLLFPLVYRVVKWASQEAQAGMARMAFRILGAGLFLSLVHEAISNVLFFVPSHLLGLEKISEETFTHILGALPAAIITRMVEFGIVYTMFTALDYQRKFRNKQIELAQMESQLSGAQLNALRLQLQPHFLFNTLNAISSLMDFDKKKAQKIVSQLGSLLRFVLDQNKKQHVPLRDELDFVRNYLNIEQVRFLDRLTTTYDIAPDTLDAQVPSLLLQPLVENAIKHGFASQTGQGHIQVKSLRENGHILLTVTDDGNGSTIDVNNLPGSGIGLKNVQERLELIYKGDASMQIHTAEGEGFEVKIKLPYQRIES
jgi:sensor histidine kinase YesM